VSEQEYSLRTLVAALDVIESFTSAQDSAQGVTEISQRLGLSKAQVFRILYTLTSRGYIQQDPHTHEYALGLGFLALGEAVRSRIDLLRIAEPFLVELADISGDTTYLVVRFGEGALLADRRQGRKVLQVTTPIGHVLPHHVAAGPKVLLAYMPEPDREDRIRQIELTSYTPATIANRDELRRHLAQILKQGYAYDEGDFEPDVYAVGAPVWGHMGNVVAALSIAAPRNRCDRERQKQLSELVMSRARRLSAELGARVGELPDGGLLKQSA
jgi:DNA-binding IclR family transcriptional regulator